MAASTEDAVMRSKLHLRRYFLDKYHGDVTEPLRVFEACQGNGQVWSALKREYPLRVWGVDVKPKKGRLAIDPHRVLREGIGPVDVVDIDTHGEPWSMLEVLLQKNVGNLTLFLTWGMPKVASNPSTVQKKSVGLPESTPRILAAKATWRLGVECCIGGCLNGKPYQAEEVRAVRMERAGARVRYIGLRLKHVPNKQSA